MTVLNHGRREAVRRVVTVAVCVTVIAAVAHHHLIVRFDVAAVAFALATLGPWSTLLVAAAGTASLAVGGDLPSTVAATLLVGLVAGALIGWIIRMPADPTARPVRALVRLGGLITVALATGGVQHLLDGGSRSLGAAGEAGLAVLVGGLIAAVVAWRPTRHVVETPLFLAALLMAVSCIAALVSVDFWRRQDDSLLGAAAEGTATGFLSAVTDDLSVISAKANTSYDEDFTVERFPTLLQTIALGHETIGAAQLAEIDAARNAEPVAVISAPGVELEERLATWTRSHDAVVADVIDRQVLTFLDITLLPVPGGETHPFLVYAAPLAPASDHAIDHQRVLVVTISVPALLDVASAPTLAGPGDAKVTLDATDQTGTYSLWSTESSWDTQRTELLLLPSGRPTETMGTQATSSMSLNEWEFDFTTTVGTGIGSPIGLRRMVLLFELATGLLLVGSVLVSGDRRARRDLERERREALLAAALQGTPGWTAIVDSDDRVLIANDGPHGIDAGRLVASVPIWRNDPIALASVARLIDTARTGSVASTQYVWTDAGDEIGGMRIIDIEARPLPDPALVYLQCLDVTDERNRAMRTAQSERMETIGVLAGGLAHDFNNLLFITLGYLQMLDRQPAISGDPQIHTYVGRAIEAVERGAAVAKSLLSVARSQPLAAVPVDLHSFLAGLRPLIEQALGGAHDLRLDAGDGDLAVLVDPGRLSSGVLNTVFNARDAMTGRGTVTIGARRTDAAPVNGEPRPMISLTISDTGRGMPPEVVARAFEPFFTTKQPGSGTGLGLSTLYSFAEQSGGWATIDTTEGVGTTVTILLPPASEPEPDATPAVGHTLAAARALVLDDEPALADLVAAWLEDLGMEVKVANTPAAAFRVAAEFRPELLVSDANLSDEIDGLEVARRLLEDDPDLLVVFMTGFSDRIKALQAAGVATLAKPFTADDLRKVLSTHLGDRLARRDHGAGTKEGS